MDWNRCLLCSSQVTLNLDRCSVFWKRQDRSHLNNKIHITILNFTIYTELSENVLLESNQQECLLIFLKFCPFSLTPHKGAHIHLAKVGWKTWPQVGIYNPNWVASAVLLSFLSQILWLGTPIEGRVDGDPLYTILNTCKITTFQYFCLFVCNTQFIQFFPIQFPFLIFYITIFCYNNFS